jgi:hypothetical protein
METVREQLIKSFQSENGHFEFQFQLYENSNKGKLILSF